MSTQSMPATAAVGADAPALVDCKAAITSLIRARTAAPASLVIAKLDVWGIQGFPFCIKSSCGVSRWGRSPQAAKARAL
ncbi:hypothetical protein RNZ50_25235 [Paracoccaceae bacterium Fryx2]|nr:hypothetical protein [Paracoccaceae bacterium Fryx2]